MVNNFTMFIYLASVAKWNNSINNAIKLVIILNFDSCILQSLENDKALLLKFSSYLCEHYYYTTCMAFQITPI